MNNEKTNKGIIIENMDKNVNPRNDFFNYVNGSWIKNATIPKDKNAWGPFYALQEQTDEQLKLVFKSLFDDEYNELNPNEAFDRQKQGFIFLAFSTDAILLGDSSILAMAQLKTLV